MKKKHCAISFHKVHECAAARILKCHKVKTDVNWADIMTKAMSGTNTKRLVGHRSFLLIICLSLPPMSHPGELLPNPGTTDLSQETAS